MTHDEDWKLERVEVRRCVFPLERPFRLGQNVIEGREYVVLTVEDSVGATGNAFALARGGPSDVVLAEMVAPRWVGARLDDIEYVTRGITRSLLPHAQEGLLGRALSLIDVALWDLRGQREGASVARLLGAQRRSAPVMVVEGYPIDGESDAQFVDRLLARADEGFRFIKVAYTASDPVAFTQRLELLMSQLPDDVVVAVDVAWSWYDIELARSLLDRWNRLELGWIEDPVGADDLEQLKALKAAATAPIAMGDEVARPETLMALGRSESVDVLRVDITCAGGFTRFREVASAAGSSVISTHVYPELHVHAALGATDRGPVEMFPPSPPWDTAYKFVRPLETELEDAIRVARAPEGPGLGLEIDQLRVEEATVRSAVVNPADSRAASNWRGK
jgi:L-alanine-DL-glutamate epimerase-like enolase superfamily enzyme